MGELDDKEVILSEDTAGQDEDTRPKLVPVTESIRYRKRAQSAEKRTEALSEELAQAKSQISEMSEQLSSLQVEQGLMRKLAAAGAVDLEAAVLIAKDKVGSSDEADLDGVVEQLKKEKRYLFGSSGAVTTPRKTAAAKDRMTSSQAILEKAASKAATSGNRTDLQEYLRLRRNLI